MKAGRISKKINVLLITMIHIFVATMFEGYIFRVSDYYSKRIYIFCKLISCLSIYLFWKKVIYFKNNFSKNKEAHFFVVAFLSYFLFMLLILWITWPGTIVYDVNGLLKMARALEISYWFTYITSVFYFVSYMIFPMILAPTFLLIFLMSYVFAKMLAYLLFKYKNKIVFLSVFPFILNSVIFNNLQPHRLQFFSAIVIYLLLDMYILYDQKKKASKGIAFKWIILAAILATWRTEGLFFVLFVFIYLTLLERSCNILYMIKLLLIMLCACMVIKFPQYKYTSTHQFFSENRNLVNYVYIVANMVNIDPNIFTEEEIEIINKVTDLEAACKDATLYHINSSHSKEWTMEEYNDFRRIMIKEILKNWRLFLKMKIAEFAGASALDSGHYLYCTCNYNPEEIVENYEEAAIKFPIGRKVIISALEGHIYDNKLQSTLLYYFSYNIVIPLFLLLVTFIISIKQRNGFRFFLSGIMLGMVVIVVLTAPAAHFKYYYYIYLYGYISGIIFIIDFLHKKYLNLNYS